MADWTEDEKHGTIVFDYVGADSWSSEKGSQFTVDGDSLIIAVSQVHAMDSYNESFECVHTMTREQARKLRDWLAYNV